MWYVSLCKEAPSTHPCLAFARVLSGNMSESLLRLHIATWFCRLYGHSGHYPTHQLQHRHRHFFDRTLRHLSLIHRHRHQHRRHRHPCTLHHPHNHSYHCCQYSRLSHHTYHRRQYDELTTCIHWYTCTTWRIDNCGILNFQRV